MRPFLVTVSERGVEHHLCLIHLIKYIDFVFCISSSPLPGSHQRWKLYRPEHMFKSKWVEPTRSHCSIFMENRKCKYPSRESIASLSLWPPPRLGGLFHWQKYSSFFFFSSALNFGYYIMLLLCDGCRLFTPQTAVAKLMSLWTAFPK